MSRVERRKYLSIRYCALTAVSFGYSNPKCTLTEPWSDQGRRAITRTLFGEPTDCRSLKTFGQLDRSRFHEIVSCRLRQRSIISHVECSWTMSAVNRAKGNREEILVRLRHTYIRCLWMAPRRCHVRSLANLHFARLRMWQTPFARPNASTEPSGIGNDEWLLKTPKPPILLRGLLSLKTTILPGSELHGRPSSPGHQKFTSSTLGSEARKSNQLLSVFAMNRLTMKIYPAHRYDSEPRRQRL